MLPRTLCRLLIALGLAAACCGCGEPATPVPAEELSWFSLGGDVHDLRAARATQTGLLTLGTSPRWFGGRAERVSAAELARRRAARNEVVLEAVSAQSGDASGMRWRATVPPRPRHVTDVPSSQEGARLELAVQRRPDQDYLEVSLTLHASKRALWRETMHRASNVAPFLIGLEVNGSPVRVKSGCSALHGGTSRFVRLVEPGGSRRWTLKVDPASVRAHLGAVAAPAVTFVAVFSERQHAGWAAVDGAHPVPQLLERPFEGEPVRIRSNSVVLAWHR